MPAVVRFERVGKMFRRGEIHDSLRDLIAGGLGRLWSRRPAKNAANTFWALRNVSFAAEPGEALGIIGPNGAGKSTALKLLAGILRADEGRIHVNGRLAALIEVNAGMHGDLTGLENIYLNGAIMGMSRAEIRHKLDAIIEFSGLARFIDTPVKRYSTGMQARLGFSTAAHIAPDILLVDEVLSVGDVAFRHRCEERMRELVEEGAALVFVTHNLEQMRSICRRTLVLDGGRRTFIGAPAEAVDHYLKATMSRVGEMSYTDQPRAANTDAEILGLRFLDQQGGDLFCITPHEPLTMEIAFRLDRPVERLTLETGLRRAGGELFISINSRQHGVTYHAPRGINRVSIGLPSFPVAGGNYYAMVRAWDADRCELLGETPYCYTIQVDDHGRATGMVALEHHWSPLECMEPSGVPEPVGAS